MRILHTEWSDGWGGQERRILAEMCGMAARGHWVALATRPQARLVEKARQAGLPVFTFPFRGKLDPVTLVGLMRLIGRERVDIVNTHSGLDSWVGGLAARLAGARLLRTRHLNYPLHRSWHNFIHYLPQRIIACGEVMRRDLIERDGFPPQQLASIPTGIDFQTFRPRHSRQETRAALGLAEESWVILMVGVIRQVKRHEIALEALAALGGRVPNLVLLLAGDGPREENVRRYAEELGVADRVRFLGHRDDVPDLLAAADCFILTSRSEGVPQAVTQALGSGLPVVATAVGGVPELVQDGVTGLLVPAENPAAVADALARVATEPGLAARLAAGGQAHAQVHFSLQAMIDATEALCAQVLEQ